MLTRCIECPTGRGRSPRIAISDGRCALHASRARTAGATWRLTIHLSMRQASAISDLADGWLRMRWYLGTGRSLPLVVMRELDALGLVESHWAVMCDGDGFHKEPERERLCWGLTALGWMAADAIGHEESKRWAEARRRMDLVAGAPCEEHGMPGCCCGGAS